MFLAPFLVGKIGLLCQKLKKLKTHLFSKQILRRMPIKSCSFTAQYEVLQVEFWLSNKFLPLPAFLEAKFAFVSQWSENPKIKVVSPRNWSVRRPLYRSFSFSFHQNVPGTQISLEVQVFVFDVFSPRGISVWFQQNTQRLNFRLQVFQKLFVGGKSPIYFSGMSSVKTLWGKKYKSYCLLQKIFFFQWS